jgi:glycosyltransferase involved in cell wall biosynthesis
MRLRVGIDGRPLQPGYREHQGRGIGTYAVELVRALARQPEIELVPYFDPRFPVPAERLPGAVRPALLPGLPALRIGERLRTQLVVPWALPRRAVDVFHFPAHSDAPLALPPRAVVTVHDLILELRRDLYGWRRPLRYALARGVERAVIRRAGTIVTDSQTSKDDIVRRLGIDPGRIHVAWLGVGRRFRPATPDATLALRARLGLPERFALYLGGGDARKNLEGLLEALARLRARAAAAPPLVLAGPISREPGFPALMAQAARLGLRDAVRSLGYVEEADLPILLGAATLFVFPSLYEGFGLPPLEAMACGTPVVSSDGGSLKEVLGDAAWVVPAGDAAALAAGMERVLGDAGLRAALRERGRARAARFTWEATAEATCAAYRDAARRAGRRAA